MTLGIFLIGAVVTAMVLGALALLFYGAVLDGRDSAGEPSVGSEKEPVNDVRLEPRLDRGAARAG